ncbi:MAG: response regulator [Spirochaetota bacterium]|nr:response regulator [Spirochaetota bacterium]
MGKADILVIEDNEMNLKLIRSVLELADYDVLSASDAEGGIQLARKQHPSLILMDIQLPDMDGLSATRVIKQDPELQDIPILALTAHAMEGDDVKALESGCVGYLTKPIDTRTFPDKIEKYIQKDNSKEQRKESANNYRKRILIVDDDPINLKLLAAMLPADKYEIIKANNGEEALEKVYEECPDLILLDIMMPGIDGYEVIRRLKKNSKTMYIPVILVTALGGAEDKAKGLEVGADEFLNKPVNTAELQTRVNSLLLLKEYQEQLSSRTQSEQFFTDPILMEQSSCKLKDPPQDHLPTNLPSVLLVDDDESDIKLFMHYLSDEAYQLEMVKNGEDAISLAQHKEIDLILLDMLLPGMDGFEVCKRLKEMKETRNIQIIAVTSLCDIESKIKGIELGADDFLVKPVDRQELMARINALIKKKAYLDELCGRFQTVLNAAINDKLTNLYNHTYFKHVLDIEIKRSLRQKHPVTLMLIDIDNFKLYNDTLGHLAGDELLKQIAQLFKDHIREVDLAARYGGDEFAIIMPYVGSKEAAIIAERIRQAVWEMAFSHKSLLLPDKLSISIGIAFSPFDATTMEELIEIADRELYNAKNSGKDQVSIFNHS